MAGLNTLKTTNAGFFNINKKIINSRTYTSSLISSVGTPVVANGIATSFSQESYLIHAPLELEGVNKITISFKGTFIEGEQTQAAFELGNSFDMPLSLSFENHKVLIRYGNHEILKITNITLTNETSIVVYLILKPTSYEFTLNYGNQVIQKIGELTFTIGLNSLSSLILGNSFSNKNNFWLGSIDLKEFFIYNNGKFSYAPTIGTSWNFSNIIISDGSVTLTDKTAPLVGHAYSFDIKEISRSGNTILLTCEVSEDAYLVIREIGLYIDTPNGKVLYGTIENLNVTKTRDLPYNLAFTVNTTINVLNAIGFPAENGIVISEPPYVEFKDFTTIQQVNTYVLTNLERIIRMNAGAKGTYENSSIINAQAGIGYNRPQVVYRIQQQFEQDQDCYNSVDTFVQLTEEFRKISEKQINYNGITIEGDLEVPLNGEVSEFSTSNYITSKTSFSDTAEWKLKASFTTSNSTTGTVISFGDAEEEASLELGVRNNKCYLQISSLESIKPTGGLSDIYYFKSTSRNISGPNDTTYYAWKRRNAIPILYNFHCTNLPIGNSPLVEFPQVNTITLEHENMDPTDFTLSTRVLFDNVINTQYIVGKPNSTINNSLELLIQDGKLKANLYEALTYYGWVDSSDPTNIIYTLTKNPTNNGESVYTFSNSQMTEIGTLQNNSSGYMYKGNNQIYDYQNSLWFTLNEGTNKKVGGDLITENLITSYTLKPNRYYDITLSYSRGRYSLHYKMEPIGDEYPYVETINIYSNKVISLENTNILAVGSGIDENNITRTLSGTIDFSEFSLSSDNYWVGTSNLEYVYTLSNTPANGDTLYDNNFYAVNNSTASNYTHGTVLDESNLFPIENNTKYVVDISYSENADTQKGTYIVEKTTNNNPTTKVTVLTEEKNIEDNLSNRMDIPLTTYVGITPSATNPFSAQVNLLEWEIENEGEEWVFWHLANLRNTELTQYYRLPNYNRNQYATGDLCNLERKIRFLSNKFEGNTDVINLANPEGATLCMKVDLKNSEPKVLLYKSNLVNDIYFSLTFLNQELAFTMQTTEGMTTLSKELSIEEYAAYESRPIMITIVVSTEDSVIKMYKDNEVIAEAYTNAANVADPSIYVLSNYIEPMPTYDVVIDEETVTKVIESAKYVEDIIFIKGAISEKDLAYINTLFDATY